MRLGSFCEAAVHIYLRQHPEGLLRLRPWRELQQDIGECPGCGTTLHVHWTPARCAAEGVEPETADQVAA